MYRAEGTPSSPCTSPEIFVDLSDVVCASRERDTQTEMNELQAQLVSIAPEDPRHTFA